jgi:hypothetical protein
VSPQIKGRKQRQPDERFNTVLADSTEVNQTLIGRKINARFFLSANAALVLITLMLALVPCAGMLQPGIDREGLLRGLVAIVSISAFAALGLLYSARKDDLGWLRSFQAGRAADAGEESEDKP